MEKIYENMHEGSIVMRQSPKGGRKGGRTLGGTNRRKEVGTEGGQRRGKEAIQSGDPQCCFAVPCSRGKTSHWDALWRSDRALPAGRDAWHGPCPTRRG